MSDSLFDKDRFREAMGDMSAIDLAAKLGCTKSLVSMYLAGQRSPSKMAIQYIALILGVNPAWLCGLDVPKLMNAKIISVEDAPTASSRRKKEFNELFDQLDEDLQDAFLAQLRAIVGNPR